MLSPIINAFNAGELSPYLAGRTDVAKYNQGCSRLENFLIMPYGGAVRRPGTEYIADVKTHSSKVRLIPFQFSTTQTYILEFGNEYIRFYKDGGQIIKTGVPYEIETDYLENELFELQYVQSADVMYIVHPNYPPAKLSRAAHDDWTLADIDFIPPAFRDRNTTDTTITPSETSGNITLTASTGIFKAGHVGGIFQISHVRTDNQVTGSFDEVDEASAAIKCYGNWDFVTHNTWDGTIRIERSFDDGVSWQVYRTYSSQSDRNVDIDGNEEEENILYRIKMSAYDSGTCDWEFTVQDYYNNGTVLITGYTSGTVVSGTVKAALSSTDATAEWSEPAWCPENGYPSCIAFYEERLMLAASKAQPQTIWGSRINDWEDFTTGDYDTSALAYTIAADRVNAIRWLCSHSALLIGTADGEWKLSSSSSDTALTPTNVSMKRQSTYGSNRLQAVLVNDVVLFLQRQGRKVREFVYNFEKDGYVAPDLTILAEHITESGIINTAYQQQPDSILWCVRDDGELAGMTYERDQEVVGWHRHVTDGLFESVAIIPGTADDEIYVSVQRTIGGAVKRYVERFATREFTEQADCFFVDAGLTYDGGEAVDISAVTQASECLVTTGTEHGFITGDKVKIKDVGGMTELNDKVYSFYMVNSTQGKLKNEAGTAFVNSSNYKAYTSGGTIRKVAKTLSGLSHLEGKTVAVLADGAVCPDCVVSGGQITAAQYANKFNVGLPFVSYLQPMALDAALQDGSAQGRIKRITKVTLRLFRSLNCQIGASEENLEKVYFRDASDAMGSAAALFTGDKAVSFPGGYSSDGNILVIQNMPLPLTLIAMIPKYEVLG